MCKNYLDDFAPKVPGTAPKSPETAHVTGAVARTVAVRLDAPEPPVGDVPAPGGTDADDYALATR